jgi:hypothetical protein
MRRPRGHGFIEWLSHRFIAIGTVCAKVNSKMKSPLRRPSSHAGSRPVPNPLVLPSWWGNTAATTPSDGGVPSLFPRICLPTHRTSRYQSPCSLILTLRGFRGALCRASAPSARANRKDECGPNERLRAAGVHNCRLSHHRAADSLSSTAALRASRTPSVFVPNSAKGNLTPREAAPCCPGPCGAPPRCGVSVLGVRI